MPASLAAAAGPPTCSCSKEGVPPAMGVAESRSMAIRLSLPTSVEYSFSWPLQITCWGI